MSGKHGWLDLVDLFYQPGTGSSRNDPHSFAFVVLFVLILVFGLFAVFNYEGGPDKPRQNGPASNERTSPSSVLEPNQRRYPIPQTEYCRVKRCVDGDTLIVLSREGQERVRLIGSNTPETVRPNSPVEPYGPEATEFTRKRIEATNGNVLLEVDGDRVDKYGRRLALVWLGKESPVLLNEELIRNGLARANVQYNYSQTIKERFLTAQKRAQTEKLGIWSQSSSTLPDHTDKAANRENKSPNKARRPVAQ